MRQPTTGQGPLPLVRFWLGLNLVIFALYLIVPSALSVGEALTPRGILESLLLTALGLALGVAYARYWPLPERPGFVNIIRILLLTIPAVGISLALGLMFQPQVSALFFALAAFLGAQLRRPQVTINANDPSPRAGGRRRKTRR